MSRRFLVKNFEVTNSQNNVDFSTVLQDHVDLRAGYHWVISQGLIQLTGRDFNMTGRHFRFYLPEPRRLNIRAAGGIVPVSLSRKDIVNIFSSSDPLFELPLVPFTMENDTGILWQNAATIVIAGLPIPSNTICRNLFITEMHFTKLTANSKITGVGVDELTKVSFQDVSNTDLDTGGFRTVAEKLGTNFDKAGFFWKGSMPHDYILFPTDGRIQLDGVNNGTATYVFYFIKGFCL